MESILLQSRFKKDLEVLATLAKMIGMKFHYISEQEMEDVGLANAMQKVCTGEYVDTDKYLKNLTA